MKGSHIFSHLESISHPIISILYRDGCRSLSHCETRDWNWRRAIWSKLPPWSIASWWTCYRQVADYTTWGDGWGKVEWRDRGLVEGSIFLPRGILQRVGARRSDCIEIGQAFLFLMCSLSFEFWMNQSSLIIRSERHFWDHLLFFV